MSIIKAPRGKARDISRPPGEKAAWFVLPPIRSRKLRTEQECYCCSEKMPVGTMAVFSERRRKWRHKGCSVPLPVKCRRSRQPLGLPRGMLRTGVRANHGEGDVSDEV